MMVILLKGRRGCPACERLRWAMEQYKIPFEYQESEGKLPKLFIDGKEIFNPNISDIVRLRRKCDVETHKFGIDGSRFSDE